MTFFSPIFMAKISDDLSLIIDQVFRIFPFFYLIFRIFTMLNVVYDPFLTRKSPFFYSFHTFTYIGQHYFSKYWGDVPPVPPRSPPLRPLANSATMSTLTILWPSSLSLFIHSFIHSFIQTTERFFKSTT